MRLKRQGHKKSIIKTLFYIAILLTISSCTSEEPMKNFLIGYWSYYDNYDNCAAYSENYREVIFYDSTMFSTNLCNNYAQKNNYWVNEDTLILEGSSISIIDDKMVINEDGIKFIISVQNENTALIKQVYPLLDDSIEQITYTLNRMHSERSLPQASDFLVDFDNFFKGLRSRDTHFHKEDTKRRYSCPMEESGKDNLFKEPGTCSICGMELQEII